MNSRPTAKPCWKHSFSGRHPPSFMRKSVQSWLQCCWHASSRSVAQAGAGAARACGRGSQVCPLAELCSFIEGPAVSGYRGVRVGCCDPGLPGYRGHGVAGPVGSIGQRHRGALCHYQPFHHSLAGAQCCHLRWHSHRHAKGVRLVGRDSGLSRRRFAGSRQYPSVTVLSCEGCCLRGSLFWLGRISTTAGQRAIRNQKDLDKATKELLPSCSRYSCSLSFSFCCCRS